MIDKVLVNDFREPKGVIQRDVVKSLKFTDVFPLR